MLGYRERVHGSRYIEYVPSKRHIYEQEDEAIEENLVTNQVYVKTVAVIQSFNRLDLLRKALDSLVPAMVEAKGTAIAIFDAGSTDGSQEYIKALAATSPVPIHLVTPETGDDTSFAAGVNKVCDYAGWQWPDTEYLLLFETDNFISSGKPLLLASALLEKYTDIAAAGFTVRKHSGEYAGWGAKFPSALSFLAGQQLSARFGMEYPQIDAWRSESEFEWHEADIVYTSPLLVKKTVWIETKGLDAATFPFSDCDLDWAWKVNRMGLKLAVIKSEEVVHDNLEAISNWSQTRVQHFHRARLELLKRYRGPWVGYLKPLLLGRHLLEWLALAAAAPIRPNARRSLQKRAKLITSVLKDYR